MKGAAIEAPFALHDIPVPQPAGCNRSAQKPNFSSETTGFHCATNATGPGAADIMTSL